MSEIHTYETFSVRFSNEDGTHSTWTNYRQAEAEAIAARSSRPAEVVRETFEVTVPTSLVEWSRTHGETPIAVRPA